ncbi:hypothetical protein NIE79_003650 [Micromonospora sp. NIE79]|uniref:Uncharacterized protein n=1 Tax=Micromonospora trifolii TaxID=2911208 RepID=A0ABS9N5H3_9ACTN|nr:hypothetical protein [Micromonospora trifolii]MCG5445205.1 hypothetical protein [Micromonospora trifolii]
MPDRPDEFPTEPPAQAEQRHRLVSDQDVEDADDVLFAHPPRVVRRWLCGCGVDYPCTDVRFALLVKSSAEAGE